MVLSEIKKYLQTFHMELREDILQDLKEQKQIAVYNQEELLANELWCLIEVYNIQKNYLTMFRLLKSGKYEEAWRLMDNIDISMGNLRENFGEGMNSYNLTFINQIIKYYEKVFPDFVYTSREGIIKSEKCSICGKKASLRGGCSHIPGKLYMGELCLREVTDYEIIGVAIVKHPLDKYAILKLEGKEYNYQVLDYLMGKLDNPFRPWYVEELKRKRPEFINVGRNDKCPCGSGKKYKKCCCGTSREYGPHYRITLLGGEEMKEEAIEYLGRWVKKQTINGNR